MVGRTWGAIHDNCPVPTISLVDRLRHRSLQRSDLRRGAKHLGAPFQELAEGNG
jgi:hypothetical protein